MTRFLVHRLAAAVLTLFLVTVLVFLIVHALPGDPARVIAGPNASEADVQQIREQLRLTDPLISQYWHYLQGLFQGDLGQSAATSRPVVSEIGARLPATISLAATSTLVAAIAGVTLGVVAALRRNRPADAVVSAVAVGASAMPTFWLGLLLILAFSVGLGWLPPSGLAGWQSYVLPTITLAAFSIALITRVSRSAMLEILNLDYVRTARAKGSSEVRVVLRHALRNSAIPVVTVIGIQFGALLGGAVLTEVVFGWPGIGQLLVNSVFSRDYPVIQGIVLVFAMMVIVLNLIIDVSYAALDPRVRY